MTEKGLGYRQKKLLGALRGCGHPMTTGSLVLICFDEPDWTARKTVSVALSGLRERGLAARVRQGWWEAA